MEYHLKMGSAYQVQIFAYFHMYHDEYPFVMQTYLCTSDAKEEGILTPVFNRLPIQKECNLITKVWREGDTFHGSLLNIEIAYSVSVISEQDEKCQK